MTYSDSWRSHFQKNLCLLQQDCNGADVKLRAPHRAEDRKARTLAPQNQNGPRGCHASYHFSQTADAGRVAGKLGNSAAVVHKHYHELVKPAAASNGSPSSPPRRLPTSCKCPPPPRESMKKPKLNADAKAFVAILTRHRKQRDYAAKVFPVGFDGCHLTYQTAPAPLV